MLSSAVNHRLYVVTDPELRLAVAAESGSPTERHDQRDAERRGGKTTRARFAKDHQADA